MAGELKIAQVITRRQYRGAEVFACQLAEALSVRGHQGFVVGLYPRVEPCPRPSGVDCVDLGYRRMGINPLLVLRLGRLLGRLRPSVVQANGSDTLKYCSLARRFSPGGWPLVYRNIGLASTWATSPWRRWLGAFMLGQVDRVVSVGQAASLDFAATYGLPARKLCVIRRGFAADEAGLDWESACARLPALKSLPEDSFRLAHVGSFTPEKNHDGLLRAFAQIRTRVEDCHLLLFGDGPLRGSCEQLCQDLGLRGSVHFLGLVPEARQYLAVCHLLVLPSLTEGVPGVVVEAGLQGIPAVASDVGGVREVITHGVTGWLVQPGAPLVDAVADLLRDPDRRRRMGERAREQLAPEFRHEAVVSRFEELYRDLRDAQRFQ